MSNKGIGTIFIVAIIGISVLISGVVFMSINKKILSSKKVSNEITTSVKQEMQAESKEGLTVQKKEISGLTKEQKDEAEKEQEGVGKKTPKQFPGTTITSTSIPSATTQPLSKTQFYSPHQRLNLSFFKGVWAQPCGEIRALKYDADKMKDDGVNIFAMSVAYEVNPNGTLKLVPLSYEWENNPEKGYLYLIRKAHDAGLGIYLTVEAIYPGDIVPEGIRELVMKNTQDAVLHWAEISEQEKVELFSPMNEPTQVFGIRDGIRWSESILPLVKQRFKGETVAKLYGPEVGDFSRYGSIQGYDYVSIHIYAIDVSTSEFFDYLEKTVLPFLEDCVKKYNLKGYLFGEMGVEAGNNEWQAQIFQQFLEKTWNNTKGYFLCGWGPKIDPTDPFPDTSFTNRPAEDIIKKWYTK